MKRWKLCILVLFCLAAMLAAGCAPETDVPADVPAEDVEITTEAQTTTVPETTVPETTVPETTALETTAPEPTAAKPQGVWYTYGPESNNQRALVDAEGLTISLYWHESLRMQIAIDEILYEDERVLIFRSGSDVGYLDFRSGSHTKQWFTWLDNFTFVGTQTFERSSYANAAIAMELALRENEAAEPVRYWCVNTMYAMTQVLPDLEIVSANDSYALLCADGKYYGVNTESRRICELSLEEKDYISIVPRWNGFELVDGNKMLTEVDLMNLHEGMNPKIKQYPLVSAAQFGEYEICNFEFYAGYLYDASGKLVLVGDGNFYVHGTFLWCHDGRAMEEAAVYNQKLELIYHGTLYSPTVDDTGRLIAIRRGEPCSVYCIYLPDGTLEYESRPYEKVLKIVDDYVLAVDEGIIRLIKLDGTPVVDFGKWHDGLSFHTALGGYYAKNPAAGYESGYYFAFEDLLLDTSYEYCYVPENEEVHRYEVPDGYAYAKPVLYLYPTAETDITVTFAYPERLTTVYPAYDGTWHVTAAPDGTLTDARGRSYYCLYWEEEQTVDAIADFAEGFCVKAEDSAAFLEEALASLGFTEREANEFIIYWLPIMEQSAYNLVSFELTESREAQSPLEISPAPDSLFRMAMHLLPLDAPVDIAPQELPTLAREGFTAVEWGGVVYK